MGVTFRQTKRAYRGRDTIIRPFPIAGLLSNHCTERRHRGGQIDTRRAELLQNSTIQKRISDGKIDPMTLGGVVGERLLQRLCRVLFRPLFRGLHR